MPKVCEEVRAEYKRTDDVLGRFIEDRLERTFSETLGVQETYEEYQRWCFKEQETPISLAFFSKCMEEREVSKKRTSKGYVFVDYSLAPSKPKAEPVASHRPSNDNRQVMPWERDQGADEDFEYGPRERADYRGDTSKVRTMDASYFEAYIAYTVAKVERNQSLKRAGFG